MTTNDTMQSMPPTATETESGAAVRCGELLGGFNVICINDAGVNTSNHHRPNGCVKKGMIYRVLGEACCGLGLVILGKPTLMNGVEVGWLKERFKRQAS
jgi:hypothetical protein